MLVQVMLWGKCVRKVIIWEGKVECGDEVGQLAL